MFYEMTKLTLQAVFLAIFLAGCSGNIKTTTADEIFDATSGLSNHANDPDSNL